MFTSINKGFDVEHDPKFNLEILKKNIETCVCVCVCVCARFQMNVWMCDWNNENDDSSVWWIAHKHLAIKDKIFTIV
jgi:hypothetical protein